MRILLGTTNPAKAALFRKVLARDGVSFITLREAGIDSEPPETGADPRENAAIKAAFYGKFAEYVICNDSGLYLEPLALEDPRQPGLHVRSPQGVYLDDAAMTTYYSALAHALGGRVLAYYLNGFAVHTPNGLKSYMQSREEARLGAFWLVDTPPLACKGRPGWPLDVISLYRDGRPFLQEGDQPETQDWVDRSWIRFLENALGLAPGEEA